MESDPWIVKTHGENGLIDQCAEGMRLSFVEQRCMQYLTGHAFTPGKVLVAGNSVWTDRVHLRRHMPAFETCFFHRNLDFSVFKETAKIFGIPEDDAGKEADNHRARPGLEAALDRFKFYYDKFIAPALFAGDFTGSADKLRS
jgi:oligoribonuclease (3'-5' exoribonuclease)